MALVRAKRTHYKGALRLEGAEFEHEGKLYEHVEPVKPKPAEQATTNGTDEK